MMSHKYSHPYHNSNKPPIVVTDNDVLCGRGVNIAHHPGNERFRTLITTRADESYCTTYSASEKRAVAEECIKHIKSLDPPGRFLRREGRGQVSRGLNGPWEELSERECIKKACQALRDCNRTDRTGYAVGVAIPTDVVEKAEELATTGLTGKERAAQAAAKMAEAAAAAAAQTLKRSAAHFAANVSGRLSPSAENAAEWLKKQRTDGPEMPLGGDGMMVPPPLHPQLGDHTHLNPGFQPDPHAAAAAAAAAATYPGLGPDLLGQPGMSHSSAPFNMDSINIKIDGDLHSDDGPHSLNIAEL